MDQGRNFHHYPRSLRKTFRIGTKEIGLPCAKSKTLSTCSKGLKGYPNPPVNGGGGLNKMYLQTRCRYSYYVPYAQGNQSGLDREKPTGSPAPLPQQLAWRAPRHLFWIPPCIRSIYALVG